MSTTLLVVQGLIGVLLPILVGVVTRWGTTSAVKGTILLALSLLAGVLIDWIATPSLDLRTALLFALEAWVVAVATHFGLWKPIKATTPTPR